MCCTASFLKAKATRITWNYDKVYISYKENHWLQKKTSFPWNLGLEEMSCVDREHAALPWMMFLATSLQQSQRR